MGLSRLPKRRVRAMVAIAAAVAAASSGLPAMAQERVEPPPPATLKPSATPLRAADREWLVQLSQRTRSELAAARLAQQRTSDDGVRQYAATVAGDHQQIGDAVQRFATAKGVKLPDEGTRAQRAALDRLQAQNGSAFDRRYASDYAVTAHRDTVRLLQSAAERVQDSDIRQLAEQVLPALQQHLAMGESLRTREAGGDPRQPATTKP